jgi:hypothetical protein
MGRRILNRKDLRADFDAAESRQQETPEGQDELEDEDDAEGDEEENETEAAENDEGDADDSEEKPAPKKKAAKVVKPRTRRQPKVTRVKVVWAVFNNSNQRVAVFDYPRHQEALDLAAKLRADKKLTHFVQPVKEPIDEKKDE